MRRHLMFYVHVILPSNYIKLLYLIQSFMAHTAGPAQEEVELGVVVRGGGGGGGGEGVLCDHLGLQQLNTEVRPLPPPAPAPAGSLLRFTLISNHCNCSIRTWTCCSGGQTPTDKSASGTSRRFCVAPPLSPAPPLYDQLICRGHRSGSVTHWHTHTTCTIILTEALCCFSTSFRSNGKTRWPWSDVTTYSVPAFRNLFQLWADG